MHCSKINGTVWLKNNCWWIYIDWSFYNRGPWILTAHRVTSRYNIWITLLHALLLDQQGHWHIALSILDSVSQELLATLHCTDLQHVMTSRDGVKLISIVGDSSCWRLRNQWCDGACPADCFGKFELMYRRTHWNKINDPLPSECDPTGTCRFTPAVWYSIICGVGVHIALL